jgi:hypothetical protein
MARSPVTPLDRQLARARRRLFLQTLLEVLAWGWVGALALTAGWFLAQPWLVPDAPAWYRWAVLAGTAGAAALGAVALAVLRRPSPVAAALALDERFHLKERVTTSLTLGPEEAASPAGLALLDDVNRRLEPVRVGDRFPLRVPWGAALVPVGALALVLLAVFYKPLVHRGQAGGSEPLSPPPALKAEIDQARQRMQKKDRPRQPDDRPRSKELEHLEGELDKLARKPVETREQARALVKDMADVEDQIKKREQELARRADALKEQMKQAERLSKNKDKAGPARDLGKALDRADFRKAKDEADRLGQKLRDQEEADRLRKKLQDDKLGEQEKQQLKDQLAKLKDKELTRDQKEQLREQLQDLEDRLGRLTRNKGEQEEHLRDLERQGEIDKEQLQRELDELEKNADQMDPQELQELKELAEKLGECRQCLKEGKDGEAAKKLGEAAARCGKMGDKGEGRELARKLARLQAARRAMCRALNNQPGQASGRRPESKDGPTDSTQERAHSDLSQGRLQVIDHVPGDGFKGPRQPAEMAEDIRRAAQEAPEALDRQRLPRSARDMTRGYFEKLRGPDRNEKQAPKQ